MRIKNKFLVIIAIIVLISGIFPEFWQIGITGVISFFLAYLVTKINHNQQKKN
jgi:hypothetical protein